MTTRATEKRKRRNERSEIIIGAVVLAYGAKKSFNAVGLASKLELTPNRHFRAVLNELVKRGVLLKTKVFHNDGHYRMIYYAQNTQPMDGLMVATQ